MPAIVREAEGVVGSGGFAAFRHGARRAANEALLGRRPVARGRDNVSGRQPRLVVQLEGAVAAVRVDL